jgi:hypothetical protein
MSSLQHGELLPEHEILKDEIPAAAEEAEEHSGPKEKQVEHGAGL